MTAPRPHPDAHGGGSPPGTAPTGAGGAALRWSTAGGWAAAGAAAVVHIGDAPGANGWGLLTGLERAYCLGRRRPEQHLAGRVAAKRAVVALLGRVGQGAVDPGTVEVVPGVPRFPAALAWQPSHRPVCRAAEGDPHLAAALAGVRVSISHSGDIAVAAAIAVTGDRGRRT